MNVANPDVAYEVSINPATLEEIGRLPLTTQEEFAETFNKAREAQKKWAQTSYKERASYVLKMADYIRDNADELADCEETEYFYPQSLLQYVLFPPHPSICLRTHDRRYGLRRPTHAG